MSVAVVIATRDRPVLLRRCLDALMRQTLPPAEVIVVDDGSGPGTAAVIREFEDRLPLRTIRHASSTGPATARNDGWRLAASQLVAFTDDDCRPDGDWLSELVAAAEPDRIVVGQTMRDPEDGEVTSLLQRTFETFGLEWGYSTCNVLYPVEMLRRVGGFDESFPRPWGEDTDLACRAIDAGAQAVWTPSAVVYHAVMQMTPTDVLRDRWRVGSVVRLARKHPALRARSYYGRYWKRYHKQALVAAVGVALMPVSPVFGLLSTPWLEDAAGRLPNRASGVIGTGARLVDAGRLAGLLGLDLVEVASCARWSLREKTLLL